MCPFEATPHSLLFASGGRLAERAYLDGAPFSPTGALTRFSPGTHTLTYEDRSDCTSSGFPVHVPAQEAVLIPFALP